MFQAQFYYNFPTLTTPMQLAIAKETEIPTTIQADDVNL
jgi:hypothetical protein